MSALLFIGLLAAAQPVQAPPSPEQEGALIAGVRQQALDYSRGLADFLCTQVTHRYSAKPAAGQEPDWKPQDTLAIRVSYVRQREDYQVVRINDKHVDKPIRQVGGHRTEGEFGSILRNVFAEQNQTKLKWLRWSTFDGMPSAVLSFRIEQSRSTFGTTAHRMLRSASFNWGLEGTLEVDAETRQVLEVKFHAIDIPREAPLKDYQLSITYGRRKIAEREFLLPVKSENILSIYGIAVKAQTEFTDYRKFSSQTEIKFEEPAN